MLTEWVTASSRASATFPIVVGLGVEIANGTLYGISVGADVIFGRAASWPEPFFLNR